MGEIGCAGDSGQKRARGENLRSFSTHGAVKPVQKTGGCGLWVLALGPRRTPGVLERPPPVAPPQSTLQLVT